MSNDQPERPPTAQFLAALEVKRNAIIGFGLGVAFAVVLFVFFVALAARSPLELRAAPVYYVGLAFVVATTVGATVAVLLTVRSAVRLSRELESADGEVR